jgi:NADH:ubiquinone oxidoreductase subunit 3 (subunit A)
LIWLLQASYKGESPLSNEFSFIGLILVVSVFFSFVALVAAWLFRPKRPNRIKAMTYECGMETVGTSWVQFKVQYYIYALVFVVFDIEAVFLFPLAVAFNQLTLYMVLEMVLFIIILAGALLYVWRKGVLEWV